MSARKQQAFEQTGALGAGMKWKRGEGGSPEFFKKRGSGKAMQFNRSKPGEPPRRDTGKLAQSIFWSADRQLLMATVGTTLKYGVYLEKGATIPARTPKRKKVLVFSVGGDWVFAKRAKGFRLQKRPYCYSTLKRKQMQIANLIRSETMAFSARGGARIG